MLACEKKLMMEKVFMNCGYFISIVQESTTFFRKLQIIICWLLNNYKFKYKRGKTASNESKRVKENLI